MNDRPSVSRSSATPSTQLNSRGALYEPVRNTRHMCRKTTNTIACADHRCRFRSTIAEGDDELQVLHAAVRLARVRDVVEHQREAGHGEDAQQDRRDEPEAERVAGLQAVARDTCAEWMWRNRLEIIEAARSLSVRGQPMRHTDRRTAAAHRIARCPIVVFIWSAMVPRVPAEGRRLLRASGYARSRKSGPPVRSRSTTRSPRGDRFSANQVSGDGAGPRTTWPFVVEPAAVARALEPGGSSASRCSPRCVQTDEIA